MRIQDSVAQTGSGGQQFGVGSQLSALIQGRLSARLKGLMLDVLSNLMAVRSTGSQCSQDEHVQRAL